MILNKYNSILFLVILIYGCKTSNKSIVSSPCNDNISVKYHKVTKEDVKEGMVADKKQESVVVFFEDYYNGNVKAYANKELVFDEVIETDESLGTTEKHFTYNYSKDKSLPKLKVISENNCVEMSINKDYKLIYVYYYKDKWDIIYSNVYPTYE